VHPDQRFLLACIATVAASLAAVLLAAPPILRILIALPLLFVLPGEAVLRALGLRFLPRARAPIVVGISMAITLLGGLLLDGLGALTPLGWTAWLGGASVLAAVVARGRVTVSATTLPTVSMRHGVMLTATCAVLVLTVQSTLRNTEAYQPFHYTNFWMLPQGAVTDVYLIGINNGEGWPETYAVRLMIDQQLSAQWQNLVLEPGQGMTLPITVPPGSSAEALLFRAEQPDIIYRRVAVASKRVMGANSDIAAAGGG
jgi:hypothetical protein